MHTSRTGADASGEDPGSGGDGSFDQPFPKHLLEFGRQLEVLQASVDGDEQRGELQLPVLHHQVEQVVRFRVIGDPDVLKEAEEVSRGGRKRRFVVARKTNVITRTCMSVCLYHGLVDMTSFLKLDETICVGGRGLGVFEGVPALCRLDIQLHQRGALLSGTCRVLRH